MRLMLGSLKRVILNMPPRHGKSEFFSKYLPACYLGNYPDRNVILTSYGADFAASWGMKAKNVMLEAGPEVYGLEIDKRSDQHWTVAKYGGSMQTAGVGGPLTGKGAHLLLIDDPIKNHKEAMSETIREHQWDWLISTALTRLEPDASVAILMTRWHQDDMCGRVLKLAKETGEYWEHISLPAICEDANAPVERMLGRQVGQALWPDRYPIEALHRIKMASHFWWNGLYQQRPAPLEGHLVKQSWFRYFTKQVVDGRVFYTLHRPDGETVLAHKDLTIFLTVDLAASTKTSADYTVVSVWGLEHKTGELLWLDAKAERMEGPDQVELITKMYHTWKPELIGVEATAYQLTMVQNLVRDGLPAYKLHADTDKVSRFLPAGNAYKNGLIYHPLHAEWVSEVEAQLVTFPNADHDDHVDTCSYAVRMLHYILGAGTMDMTGY